MGEKLNLNTKEDVGEYKVPEYHVANWRDDIPEAKEEIDKDIFQFELIGKDEKGEKQYVSPSETSKETLRRIKKLKIGHRAMLLR